MSRRLISFVFAGVFLGTQMLPSMAEVPSAPVAPTHVWTPPPGFSHHIYTSGYTPTSSNGSTPIHHHHWFNAGTNTSTSNNQNSANVHSNTNSSNTNSTGASTSGTHTAPSVNLDLASTSPTTTAGYFLHNGTVTINVGGNTLTVNSTTPLTAAEKVAVMEVIRTGHQTLLLNANGAADGGIMVISPRLSQHIAELVIPKGVSVTDISRTGILNITGNLTDSGSLYVTTTNPLLSNFSILANTITIGSQGLITTNLPSSNPLFGIAPQNLGLTLTTQGNIVNAGTIASTGTVNLNTGSGNITNTGLIASNNGNVNIASTNPGNDINIYGSANGTTGTFQALNGDINVRDASYAGSGNINMGGGNYLSNNLNLNSGTGTINANVGEVTGNVNSNAGAAYVQTATPMLMLGNNSESGDPTFYNDAGSIEINGSINVTGDLAIVASNNIFMDSGNYSITTNGNNLLMIAGANISTSGCTSCTSSPTLSGNPPSGGISTGTISVDLVQSSTNGGYIDLSASTANTIINTYNGINQGGSVTLVALAGISGGGYVNLYNSSVVGQVSINSGGGNITVYANGANGSGNAITAGNIVTAPGYNANGGNVTLTTANATTSDTNSLVINSSGDIQSNNSIVAGNTLGTGNVTVNAIDTDAYNGGSNPGPNGGNVVINTGGSISITGGINNPQSVSVGIFTAGGSGSGGSVTLSAGNTVNITNSIDTDAANDSGINGGNVTITATSDITIGGSIITQSGTGLGNGGAVALNSGGAVTVTNGIDTDAWSSNGNNGGAVIINATGAITMSNGEILTRSGFGNGGSVTLASGGSVTIANGIGTDADLSSGVGGVNGGAVIINATGSVTINPAGIFTDSGSGNSGAVTINSSGGTVSINGGISTNSNGVNGGAVAITANDNITMNTGAVSTTGGVGNGGAVNLVSTTGAVTISQGINTSSTTGSNGGANGGNVFISAGGSNSNTNGIEIGGISTQGGPGGNGGSVTLVTTSSIANISITSGSIDTDAANPGNPGINGGNVTIYTLGSFNIDNGSVLTYAGYGNGGAVSIIGDAVSISSGNIDTDASASFSSVVGGINGGNVLISAGFTGIHAIIIGNILTTGGVGNGGSMAIVSAGGIYTGTIGTSGNASIYLSSGYQSSGLSNYAISTGAITLGSGPLYAIAAINTNATTSMPVPVGNITSNFASGSSISMLGGDVNASSGYVTTTGSYSSINVLPSNYDSATAVVTTFTPASIPGGGFASFSNPGTITLVNDSGTTGSVITFNNLLPIVSQSNVTSLGTINDNTGVGGSTGSATFSLIAPVVSISSPVTYVGTGTFDITAFRLSLNNGSGVNLTTTGANVNLVGVENVTTQIIDTTNGGTANGGSVALTCYTGDITVNGNINTYVSTGSATAGNVTITTPGNITVNGNIGAYNAGTGAGGVVNISSGNNVLVTDEVDTDANEGTTPGTNGGAVTITAGGTITVANDQIYTIAGTGNGGAVILNAGGAISIPQGIDTDASTANGINGGTVIINAGGSINTGTIDSSGGTGVGGNVVLTAPTSSITVGDIDTFSGGTTAGSISLVANGNLTVGGVQTFNYGSGSGGNVYLVSNSGTITISSEGINTNNNTGSSASSGNVSISAFGDINIGGGIEGINLGSGNGGNVIIGSSTGSITFAQDINTSTVGSGNAGNVYVMAYGAISFPNNIINTSTTGAGNGGNVTLISTNNGVTLGSINFGPTNINTYASGAGAAGNIIISALGPISTGNLQAYNTGTGNGGSVALISASTISIEGIRVDSNSGTSGSVYLSSGYTSSSSTDYAISTGVINLGTGGGTGQLYAIAATNSGSGSAGFPNSISGFTSGNSLAMTGGDINGGSSSFASIATTGSYTSITILPSNLNVISSTIMSPSSIPGGGFASFSNSGTINLINDPGTTGNVITFSNLVPIVVQSTINSLNTISDSIGSTNFVLIAPGISSSAPLTYSTSTGSLSIYASQITFSDSTGTGATISAPGANVNLIGFQGITTEGITTATTTAAANSGAVTLLSANSVSVASIDTDAFNSGSNTSVNGGNVSITAGGSIDLTSSVTSGGAAIYTSPGTGNAGAVTLTSGSGSVTFSIGGINAAGPPSAGVNGNNVTINAIGSISILGTSGFGSPSYGIYTGAGSGNSGLVTLTSASGSVNVYSGIDTDAAFVPGINGGNVTISAPFGSITLPQVGVITSGGTGNSGSITLTAGGNIVTTNLDTHTDGIGAAGAITEISTNGSIVNNAVSSDVTNASAVGNAGSVNISASNYIVLGDTSVGPQTIDTHNVGTGAAGNVTLTSSNGFVVLGSIDSSSGSGGGSNGGTVTIVTPNKIDGSVNIANGIDTDGATRIGSNGGNVTINVGETIAINGASVNNGLIGIYAGSGSENGGSVTLTAGGSVNLVLDIQTDAYIGQGISGGNVIINAGDSINISTGGIGTQSGTGNGGSVTLVVGGSIYLNTGIVTQAGSPYPGINGGNVLISSGGSVNTSSIGITTSGGSGNGGSVTILSGSTVTLAGGIDTHTNGLNGGNVIVVTADTSANSMAISEITTQGTVNGGSIALIGAGAISIPIGIATNGSASVYLSSGYIDSGYAISAGSISIGSGPFYAIAAINSNTINSLPVTNIQPFSNGSGLNMTGGDLNGVSAASATVTTTGTYSSINILPSNYNSSTAAVTTITPSTIPGGGFASFSNPSEINIANDITTGSGNIISFANLVPVVSQTAVSAVGTINDQTGFNGSTGFANFLLIAPSVSESNVAMYNSTGTFSVLANQININYIITTGANVNLTGIQNITTGIIDTTNGGLWSGASVTLTAYDDITTGNIETYTFGGITPAGNVFITDPGNITTGNINALNSGSGASGNVLILSTGGSVTTGYITTGVTSATSTQPAGSVVISATGNINVGAEIFTTNDGLGAGGNVTLISQAGSIQTTTINTYSVGGNGGSVTAVSGGKSLGTNGAFSIQTGSITTSGTSGGFVEILSIDSAASPVTVGTINTQATSATGSGGAIGISTLGALTVGDINTSNISTSAINGAARSGSVFLSSGTSVNSGNITAVNSVLTDDPAQVVLVSTGIIFNGTISVANSQSLIDPNFVSTATSINTNAGDVTINLGYTGISSNYNPQGYTYIGGTSNSLIINTNNDPALLAPIVSLGSISLNNVEINSGIDPTTANSLALVAVNDISLTYLNNGGNTYGGNVNLLSIANSVSVNSVIDTYISTSTDTVAAGNVTITALGNVSVNTTGNSSDGIFAYNNGAGAGGTVSLTSINGAVTLGTAGNNGEIWTANVSNNSTAASGNVTILANSNIAVNGDTLTYNSALGNAGSVTYTSLTGTVQTTDVVTTVGSPSSFFTNSPGNAGNITISTYGGYTQTSGNDGHNLFALDNGHGAGGSVTLLSSNGDIGLTSTTTQPNINTSAGSGVLTSSPAGNIVILAGGEISITNTVMGESGSIGASNSGFNSAGSILLVSGNLINSNAMSITASNSGAGLGAAGNITVIAQGNISQLGAVGASNAGAGAAGWVTLMSVNGSLTAGEIDTHASDAAPAGNVVVEAAGNISTDSIYAPNLGTSNGGTVTITSTGGHVLAGEIDTYASGGVGAAGNVTITAGGPNGDGYIGTSSIFACGGCAGAAGLSSSGAGIGPGGTVTLISNNDTILINPTSSGDNAIDTSSNGPLAAGNVIIVASPGVTGAGAPDINANINAINSGTGSGGSIAIVSGGSIVIENIATSGTAASVYLSSGSGISTGNITLNGAALFATVAAGGSTVTEVVPFTSGSFLVMGTGTGPQIYSSLITTPQTGLNISILPQAYSNTAISVAITPSQLPGGGFTSFSNSEDILLENDGYMSFGNLIPFVSASTITQISTIVNLSGGVANFFLIAPAVNVTSGGGGIIPQFVDAGGTGGSFSILANTINLSTGIETLGSGGLPTPTINLIGIQGITTGIIDTTYGGVCAGSSVTLGSSAGSISTGEIDTYVSNGGFLGSSGNVTVSAFGNIATNDINAYNFASIGIGNGGTVSLTSNTGAIAVGHIDAHTASNFGTSGSLDISAYGSIYTGNIETENGGLNVSQAGSVTVLSTNGYVNLGTINTSNIGSAAAGNVTIGAYGPIVIVSINSAHEATGTDAGYGGAVSICSTNAYVVTDGIDTGATGTGAAGNVTITAGGGQGYGYINLNGDINSYNTGGGTSGTVVLAAYNGAVSAQNINTYSGSSSAAGNVIVVAGGFGGITLGGNINTGNNGSGASGSVALVSMGQINTQAIGVSDTSGTASVYLSSGYNGTGSAIQTGTITLGNASLLATAATSGTVVVQSFTTGNLITANPGQIFETGAYGSTSVTIVSPTLNNSGTLVVTPASLPAGGFSAFTNTGEMQLANDASGVGNMTFDKFVPIVVQGASGITSLGYINDNTGTNGASINANFVLLASSVNANQNAGLTSLPTPIYVIVGGNISIYGPIATGGSYLYGTPPSGQGSVTLVSGGSISVSSINTAGYDESGNGGNVYLEAAGNINLNGNITTDSAEFTTAGTVNIISTAGSINGAGYNISAAGVDDTTSNGSVYTGSGNNIYLLAQAGSISLNSAIASSAGVSGNVTIRSGGAVSLTGLLDTNSSNEYGNVSSAGNVYIVSGPTQNSSPSFVVNYGINASGTYINSFNQGGNITIVSDGDIVIGGGLNTSTLDSGNGGAINIVSSANSSIVITGGINTASASIANGAFGGSINVNAGGSLTLIGNVNAIGNLGNFCGGGAIILSALNGAINTNGYSITSNGSSTDSNAILGSIVLVSTGGISGINTGDLSGTSIAVVSPGAIQTGNITTNGNQLFLSSGTSILTNVVSLSGGTLFATVAAAGTTITPNLINPVNTSGTFSVSIQQGSNIQIEESNVASPTAITTLPANYSNTGTGVITPSIIAGGGFTSLTNTGVLSLQNDSYFNFSGTNTLLNAAPIVVANAISSIGTISDGTGFGALFFFAPVIGNGSGINPVIVNMNGQVFINASTINSDGGGVTLAAGGLMGLSAYSIKTIGGTISLMTSAAGPVGDDFDLNLMAGHINTNLTGNTGGGVLVSSGENLYMLGDNIVTGGGAIVMTAGNPFLGGQIQVGSNLNTSSSTGNGGNVVIVNLDVNTGNNVSVGNIQTGSSYASGNGGSIVLASPGGNVTYENIITTSVHGNGGDVFLTAGNTTGITISGASIDTSTASTSASNTAGQIWAIYAGVNGASLPSLGTVVQDYSGGSLAPVGGASYISMQSVQNAVAVTGSTTVTFTPYVNSGSTGGVVVSGTGFGAGGFGQINDTSNPINLTIAVNGNDNALIVPIAPYNNSSIISSMTNPLSSITVEANSAAGLPSLAIFAPGGDNNDAAFQLNNLTTNQVGVPVNIAAIASNGATIYINNSGIVGQTINLGANIINGSQTTTGLTNIALGFNIATNDTLTISGPQTTQENYIINGPLSSRMTVINDAQDYAGSIFGVNNGPTGPITLSGTGSITAQFINLGNLDPSTGIILPLYTTVGTYTAAAPFNSSTTIGSVTFDPNSIVGTLQVNAYTPYVPPTPTPTPSGGSGTVPWYLQAQQYIAYLNYLHELQQILFGDPLTKLYEQIGTRVATDYTPILSPPDLWYLNSRLPGPWIRTDATFVPSQPLQGHVTNEESNKTGQGLFASSSFNANELTALSNQGIVFGPDSKDSFLNLQQGFVLCMPKSDITVQTQEGLVSIPKGAVAWIMETGHDVAIYNFHTTLRTGRIKVITNKKEITLIPGTEVLLTRNMSEQFHTLNPGIGIGSRNVKSSDLGAGIKAYICDFSIPDGLNNVPVIHSLLKSNNPEHRKVAWKMIKNATILADLTQRAGPYQTKP